MRWQFVVAGVLALAGLFVVVWPRLGSEPNATLWYVGLPLLVAAAVIFEWGWLRAKEHT